MRFLLDTNVVSLALKGRAPAAVERLSATPRENVAVSVITAMELEFGLARVPEAHRIHAVVRRFLETIPIHTLPQDIAPVYGRVRKELEETGKPIGALDTIIAAHALSTGATLVTNNLREFRRVRDLDCDDWTA